MQHEAPAGHSDWSDLAKVAARLHADRAGVLPADDPRVERMAIVAAVWRAVTTRAPIDAPAADWPAIRADLAETFHRAADRATRAPGDLAIHHTRDAIAAIAWHFDPVSPRIDTPQIVFCHTTTLAIRARIAAARRAPSSPALPQSVRQRSQPAGPLFGAAA